MKYLLDIGHPAHVHYYKNFAKTVLSRGDRVLFTCRDKEVTIALLEHYHLSYISFGRSYKSVTGKIFGLFYFTWRVFFIALRFKPDIILNASMYGAICAWLLRKPHVSLEDTFNMEQVKLYLPFTGCVLTGDYEHPPLGPKELQFSGYQELLYLHPNHFTPDKSVTGELGLSENEPYVIVRFVSWDASHDIGHSGINMQNKLEAVKAFSHYSKVFISSEKPLPPDLEPYRFPLSPERMHHAMAFASLIYGESATMVSEGAMLGIPGIYLDNTGRYYTTDQEKSFALVFNYSESPEDQKKSIEKGVELLKTPGIREQWQEKRRKMLEQKIDVPAFFVWFVDHYPESHRIMKENPGFQYNFK
ncbi:MAG: hypothetical protein JXA03_00425 [Bacteroidales bacterium]|nr:hypothetical protein [Bacteroidales bacterium]